MIWSYLLFNILCCYLTTTVRGVTKNGLLLLYRPLDVSNECAISGRLRYDLSFGMGMSDTITMVFRTLNGIDYECNIEVTAPSEDIYLVVVIKFPTNLLMNCFSNEDAFMVMKKNKCLRLCELLGDRNVFSSYFVITVKGRLRFRFLSNSSINSDINANMYQVTATTARMKPPTQMCHIGNETLCVIDRQDFCFTSGVVCDGIKNCGVRDWYYPFYVLMTMIQSSEFDERQSECSLPVEYLGYAPVIAVVAVLACTLLAAGHVLLRCLPPLASSFFIFNANEDNRLCIDPVLYPPDITTSSLEKAKRISLIPVLSSSSSDMTSENDSDETTPPPHVQPSSSISKERKHSEWDAGPSKKRGQIVRVMAEKIQETLHSVTGKGKLLRASTLDLRIDQV